MPFSTGQHRNFDCYRQFSSVPLSLSLTAENTLIMYSTMPGCKAYAPSDSGPLMTNKLAELFRNKRTQLLTLKLSSPVSLKAMIKYSSGNAPTQPAHLTSGRTGR